jgi:hypothetical protein
MIQGHQNFLGGFLDFFVFASKSKNEINLAWWMKALGNDSH